MPRSPVTHWNPPESVPQWHSYKGKTRCGRKLGQVVSWSADHKDVTCDRCSQLAYKDGVR